MSITTQPTLREEQCLSMCRWVIRAALTIALAVITSMGPHLAVAADKAEINRDVDAALVKLYSGSTEAKLLAEKAAGILVFPSIVKGGFIIGGMYGEGALRVNGKTTGYYNAVAASYGLQAGVQTFGYAVMFMNEAKLKYLDESDGWEIGGAPSLVIVDKGAAGSLSTTSVRNDIYVFFFDQSGLMAGLGLQGTKISKINP